MSRPLAEPEILAYLDVCAWTLSDTLGDPDAPDAALWAYDDARWLWEAPQGLTSRLPLRAARIALAPRRQR